MFKQNNNSLLHDNKKGNIIRSIPWLMYNSFAYVWQREETRAIKRKRHQQQFYQPNSPWKSRLLLGIPSDGALFTREKPKFNHVDKRDANLKCLLLRTINWKLKPFHQGERERERRCSPWCRDEFSRMFGDSICERNFPVKKFVFHKQSSSPLFIR